MSRVHAPLPLPKGLGLVVDRPDPRDYRLKLDRPFTVATDFSDYEAEMSPVKDQGMRGACVAFGTVAVKEWQEREERGTRGFYDFSEEWIYEQIRLPGGGAYPREAMKLLSERGVPREHLLPYRERPDEDTPANFTPTKTQVRNAAFYKARDYVRLTSLQEIEASLATNGPITLGLDWQFGWFEPTGLEHKGYPVLRAQPTGSAGGHLICVCAHDRTVALKKIRNSWGPEWSKGGYAWIEYAAVESFGLDAWASLDAEKVARLGLDIIKPDAAKEENA